MVLVHFPAIDISDYCRYSHHWWCCPEKDKMSFESVLLHMKFLSGSIRHGEFFADHQTHSIHVWYICLHLVDFYGKCRQIPSMDGMGNG